MERSKILGAKMNNFKTIFEENLNNYNSNFK